MKTINEQIIEKQDEIISDYKMLSQNIYNLNLVSSLLMKIKKCNEELSALKQQAEKTPAKELSNNRQQSESNANNLKTAEEILRDEMSESLWAFICSYPVSYKSEEKLVEWIIDAMQEYAAQFKAEQEKYGITDKIIEGAMNINSPFFGNSGATVPMIDQEKDYLRLKIFEEIKLHFNLYSDMSTFCLGYRYLEREIESMKKGKEKQYATLGGGVSDGCNYPGELNYKEQDKVTDETLDLQQYVTNLLYYAHVEAMDMHSIDFDKWVEREVDNLAEYLNKEKVTDEDIEKWMMYQDMYEFDSIWDAIRYGAKAMRDGLITHNK